MSFIHLHVHSEYSLLDGISRLPDLVQGAKEAGMSALALTDHGGVYGLVPFYKLCRAEGIRPILGTELYIAPDMYKREKGDACHIVLLAENNVGYRNLLRLVTLAHLEGFYQKPRIDLNALSRYKEGLIVLSACLFGQIPQKVLAGDLAGAYELAAVYRDILGPDQFYLELMDHGLSEERKVGRALVKMAADLRLPLVATNDVHYLRPEDADPEKVLLAVQTLSVVGNGEKLALPGKEYWLKPAAAMAALFREIPSSIENTGLIAERCRAEIDLKALHIPTFPVPAGYNHQSYLRKLCYENLPVFYKTPPEPMVVERLEYELSVIEAMGFSGYFLIVWDAVQFARRNNIPVGPGRGSAGGSLVAYLLSITQVDPLEHGLLFERFLNPERVGMPDIDLDLCYRGREKVLHYLKEKYGWEHFAHLGAFTTFTARSVVRDTGRALGKAYQKIDQLTRLIPYSGTIDGALADSLHLKKLYEQDEDTRKILDTARKLEKLPRHLTQHAAGVVLADGPLTHYTALQRTGSGEIITQFDMEAVEDIGLLKIDLLGLRYLSVVYDTCALLAKYYGIRLAPEDIPLDDPATFATIAAGRTVGCFQIESAGMRRLCEKYQPENLSDIGAILALYRPGPLGSGMVDDFINRRHGREEVTYLHPLLAEVLKETYGVILYQEQVMLVAKVIAGFSLGQADILRKAVAKRNPELLAAQREAFIRGAEGQGVPHRTAEQIFNLLLKFGDYGFNKAHSAAYAYTVYRTVYLKTHYPVAYMAALLSANLGMDDRLRAYLSEAKHLGIRLLLPDINKSEFAFTPEGNAIRAGFFLVRDLGEAGIKAILQERQARGPFASLADFCRRINRRAVGCRAVENLIKAGAFDFTGLTRSTLLLMARPLLFKERPAIPPEGQLSFLLAENTEADWHHPHLPEFPASERLTMEYEALGHYISQHPLEMYRDFFPLLKVRPLSEAIEREMGAKVRVLVTITGGRRHRTRDQKLMLFLTAEDLSGRAEAVVFPKAYERYAPYLHIGAVLIIDGHIDATGEAPNLIVEKVTPLGKQLTKHYQASAK